MVFSSTLITAAMDSPNRKDRQPVRDALAKTVAVMARVLLVVAVTLPAWCFGCVLPGATTMLLGLTVVILVCALCAVTWKGMQSAVMPWALVPLLGGLGLGAFQLMPLDAKMLGAISPRAMELRRTLNSADTPLEQSMLQSLGLAADSTRQPLSLYPAVTRRDLALLSLTVGVFVGGAVFFRTPASQMWLCAAMAINGGVLSFHYLVQLLTHGVNWRLGWSESESLVLPGLGVAIGPLVNRNNAGGHLNLCLAGAIAILLWSAGRLRYQQQGRWELQISAVVAASLIVAGVFCTMSRGAILSMLIAMMMLVVLWVGQRKIRLWWGVLTLISGVGLVAWINRLDMVYARVATLFTTSSAAEGRLVNWASALSAVPDFWRCGSGLGTYGYIYRLYERPTYSGWYDHAENQPLEALVDGGLVGLALLVAAVVLVGIGAWQLQHGASDSCSFAFAWGVLFGIVSQSIHGLADFGLFMPSNAVLLAVVCGAVTGGAVESRVWRRSAVHVATTWGPKLAAVSAVLVVLTACTWGWAETRRSASVGTVLRRVAAEPTNEKTTPDSLRKRLAELTAALTNNEDHAEGQWLASQLWSDLYRVCLFAQLRAVSAASVTDQALWAATSLVGVHGQAYVVSTGVSRESLQQWRNQEMYHDYLIPALRCALAARSGCPLLVDPRLAIAQLCGLVTSPQHDERELERARWLAPENQELLYWTGLLELQAGRPVLACRDWRRLLELAESVPSVRAAEVLRIATTQLPAWQVIERLLPDRPAILVQVAEQWYGGPKQAEARRAIADRINEVLDQPGSDGGERDYFLGRACELRGATAEAIEHYTKAVKLNPWADAWRYRLAVLLHGEGRDDEALEQARGCAQRSPGNVEYRTLLQRIHRARLTTKSS